MHFSVHFVVYTAHKGLEGEMLPSSAMSINCIYAIIIYTDENSASRGDSSLSLMNCQVLQSYLSIRQQVKQLILFALST